MWNLMQKLREWSEWEYDRWESNRWCEVQKNPLTGKWRYRHVCLSATDPVYEGWKPGKPPRPERPEPPKSGSGVRPKPAPKPGPGINEVLKAIDDTPREVADDMPEPAPKPSPGRRLSITPAPSGGFIVGEQEHRHTMPFFANRYAGNLTDCLEFIRRELVRAEP